MNLGLLFYKLYYRKIDYKKLDPKGKESHHGDILKDLNAQLLGSQLRYPEDVLANPLAHQQPEMRTVYPGLMTGIGYLHDMREDEAFKLGFTFDHTTGLPYLPGSTVKGLLRHGCERNNYALLHHVISELQAKDKQFAVGEVDAKAFVAEVFEGQRNNDQLPQHARDIFFDAFPCASGHYQNYFLGDDYITPHKHDSKKVKSEDKTKNLDGLQAPTPLKFLKILPDVTFRFHFDLRGDKAGISATDRLKIFLQLLSELGIGAKTNVGYGILTQRDKPTMPVKGTDAPGVIEKEFEPNIPTDAVQYLTTGEIFPGTVIGKDENYVFLSFQVSAKEAQIRKRFDSIKNKDKKRLESIDQVAEGDELVITINKDYVHGETTVNCSAKLTNK